ncbi:hypothetical protein ABER02_16620 [Rossellomorea marisflavi]|uniref:hypothetical protein n=1 Tax=Rossellomorea marisflavi TaxID=189381 RepID=UPI003D2B1B85
MTDKEVYKILYLNKVKGYQPHQLETTFSVARSTIKNIVNGKSRKDCYFAFIEYMENHPKEVMSLFD